MSYNLKTIEVRGKKEFFQISYRKTLIKQSIELDKI